MRFLWILIFAIPALGFGQAPPHGQAEHVVVIVWDGMRPDFITPQFTPTLYDLALRGTFFKHHHSAYVTSTEVNATALATGMLPDHSGVIANSEYRPEFSWLASYGTESLDAVRRGDLLSQGHYLATATVAEILQQAGFPTIIAGAKPVALLHDRAQHRTLHAAKESVTLFRGQTLPRSALEALVKTREIGPLPAGMGPTNADSGKRSRRFATAGTNNATELSSASTDASVANTPDSWTTKALVHGFWKKGVPKYSLLWLSEPDSSQHESGVGSEPAVAALENSDKNLATVLKALEDKGVLGSTDIFVVSDHGFSTVHRGPELMESLRRAKFTVGSQFQNPETGDILVVNLGGSLSFYVFDHDQDVIRRLVTYLQGTDFAGLIFCGLPIEGTFTLAQAHVNPSNGAPDVVVSLRWTAENNEFGAPGLISSIEAKSGRGAHASLSRFDLHNTLVAAGPDFKSGFVDELPTGNIDLAPTVLSILGVAPSCAMDGRVLHEAMTGEQPSPPKPTEQTLEASRDLGFLRWHQHLKLTRIGSAIYYEEGNGECQFK